MLLRLIKKTGKILSLKEFYNNRNKVLICHNGGGLGDIIMIRMIFEDIYKTMPGINLTFACYKKYFDIVKDHPFLDNVIDCCSDLSDFGIIYYTNRKEFNATHGNLHKSDFWGRECGVEITSHETHFKISEEIVSIAKKQINSNKPNVLFIPFTNNGIEKNLTQQQITETVDGLKKRGFFVLGLHQEYQDFLELGYDQFLFTNKLDEWKAIIATVDYIISIDTATFHMAGVLKKPLVGIFSWTDGKIYGKYFDFILVQKHKDTDKDWCGPCGNWANCPKVQSYNEIKPCVKEILSLDILEAFDKIISKKITLPLIN